MENGQGLGCGTFDGTSETIDRFDSTFGILRPLWIWE